MKALIFVFSLAFIYGESDNSRWKPLDEFQQFLTAYKIDVETLINSTLDTIRDGVGPSSDVLGEISSWPRPWENSLWDKAPCKVEFPNRVKLQIQLLIRLKALEEPMWKRINYVRYRLDEIQLSLSMLKTWANFKNRNIENTIDVSPESLASMEENVNLLRCKLLKNCQKHTITKRSNTYCSSTEFKCRNGECIDAVDVCSGIKTCSDGSDEGPLCSKFCFNGFHCENLKCIDKLLVCDGKDDCGDNSDETDCGKRQGKYSSENCTLESGMFLCDNYNCVSLVEACDGVDGCGDGSDEGSSCGKGCPGGCEALGGVCLTTPRGPLCLNKCPAGFIDTALGCQPLPERLPATVEEMVEEIPAMAMKCISSAHRLKQEILSRLFKAYNDFSQCYDDIEYNKITKLTNFNETYNYNNTINFKST